MREGAIIHKTNALAGWCNLCCAGVPGMFKTPMRHVGRQLDLSDDDGKLSLANQCGAVKQS